MPSQLVASILAASHLGVVALHRLEHGLAQGQADAGGAPDMGAEASGGESTEEEPVDADFEVKS